MINLSCPGWNVNRIVMNIHDPCKHFRLIETMPIAKVAENWQPNSKNLKHYKGLQKSVVIKSATIRGNWLEPPAMLFDFDLKLARLPKNRNPVNAGLGI